MKLDDLTGKKFGKLTVLRRGETRRYKSKQSHVAWICQCDCGNICEKTAVGLKNYKIPSCGCAEKEARSEGRLEDLTGQRFGRLVVMYRASDIGELAKWHCKCDCGNECDVFASNLKKKGHTTSCGCYNSENVTRMKTKHGYRHTRIYDVFSHMKDRCNNPNNPSYPRYGGRGIKICSEWENDPGSFCKWAYDNGYDENAGYGETTIDRIDNNKGYSPENCRVVTFKTQSNNRRSNLFIEHNGERKTLAQWRDYFGLSQWKAYHYLVEKKYTIQDLIDKGIV